MPLYMHTASNLRVYDLRLMQCVEAWQHWNRQWPLILTRTCTFSINISNHSYLLLFELAHTTHEICIFYGSGLLKEERWDWVATSDSQAQDKWSHTRRRSQRHAFNIAMECRVLRSCLYASAYTSQRLYDTKVYQTYHISQYDDENNE